MTRNFLTKTALWAVAVLPVTSALAQDKTTPITPAQVEAAYADAIRQRTMDIIALLDLKDAAKSNRIAEVITRQYRALRARDEVLDAAAGPEAVTDLAVGSLYESITSPLHSRFLAKLSADLTPDQVEKVKDKMTYNKVKVTYDAYCDIVPNLTEAQKTKILESLKAAREVAMDAGSANKKTEVFQKYKDQINAYLTAEGHDVAKAFADYTAKQDAAKQTQAGAAGAGQPAQ